MFYWVWYEEVDRCIEEQYYPDQFDVMADDIKGMLEDGFSVRIKVFNRGDK